MPSTDPKAVNPSCDCPAFVEPRADLNLRCKHCNAPHDVDMALDVGYCVICGGALIEDEVERELVAGKRFAEAITSAVADGLTAAAKIRGKAPRGVN